VTAEEEFEANRTIATAEEEFEVDGEGTEHLNNTEEEEEEPGVEGEDAWDTVLEGFAPELLLTFPLPPRTDEFFYEDVPAGPPVLIRGFFSASASEEPSSVEFSVTDPHGEDVFEKSDEPEGLFHFVATEPGTYTFILSNHRWTEEKMVTFAVGKGNKTHLQAKHLETMEDHIKSIERTLLDIQTESTFLWMRQKSHMKAVESIHTRVLAFCVVEFLILVGISGFQVYYVKGVLSDRRIL